MYQTITLALLVLEGSAMTHHHKHHHSFRPIPGTAPWNEPVEHPVLHDDPSHYQVPAFGFEHDMIPRNNRDPYTYPTSLVQSGLRLRDDPICSSAGCTQYKHPEGPKGYPMDYPVPSFGADPDIEATANSIAVMEDYYKHKIIMGTDKSKAQWANPAKDVDYNFAPELDHDMIVTHTNLVNAERELGERMD